MLSYPRLPHAAVVRAATGRVGGSLLLLERMAFAQLPFARLAGRGVVLHRRPAALSTSPLSSRVGALRPGACTPAGARPYPWMHAGLGDCGGSDPDADQLSWTQGEIKQKKVELSKLNERLRENEKKLDADGLAADKKRRLESDRVFVIKEGEYLVEALSDLCSIQKTITIAKTARLGSPLSTRVSFSVSSLPVAGIFLFRQFVHSLLSPQSHGRAPLLCFLPGSFCTPMVLLPCLVSGLAPHADFHRHRAAGEH